jgi:4-amino-4-deoxy-L-arabinose transferase-like glycosyltransferase
MGAVPITRRAPVAAVLLAAIAWALWLPLHDVLTYPDRVSVLPNLETDAAAYDAFAQQLAASWHVAALPAKHPPGWMAALAAVYATVGHSYVAGKLVSWVALVLMVGLCAWLASRVFDRAAGGVAALLCASSPGFRGYVGTLQYEVLTAALVALVLVLAIRVTDAANARQALTRAGIAGLAGGALVLTRETFVLVIPLLAFWIWQRLRQTLDRTAARAAAGLLIVVAATPAILWSGVQTVHYGRLILVSEKGPKEFLLGNNPLANGAYNEPQAGMAEPAGFAYIKTFPWQALRLAGRKTLYFFGALRDGWNVPHPATIWIWRATTGALPLAVITPFTGGGWLLVAAVCSLYLLGSSGLRRWWILPATVAAILMIHVITLASYRFAVPILPVLIVLASGATVAAGRVAGRALRTPAVRLGALLIFVMAVGAQYRSWPLHAEYDAVDLEGVEAANVPDPVIGSAVRLADAKRGVRPVALLPDSYFPRGPLTLSVAMRRTGSEPVAQAVARIALVDLDGRPACAADVSPAQLEVSRFSEVALSCQLARDGPATVAVYSLAQADFAIASIRLRWRDR